MSKGAIPEFVPITDISTVYKILTDANEKNKILERSLAGLNEQEAYNEDINQE